MDLVYQLNNLFAKKTHPVVLKAGYSNTVVQSL